LANCKHNDTFRGDFGKDERGERESGVGREMMRKWER
jgi:hypothetical protein